MKKQNKKIEKWVDENTGDSNKDQQKWESGELGRDIEYSKVSQELSSHDRPMPTSIRLPKNLIDELKLLAQEEGLPYQTYLKMVLIKHVKHVKESKSA